MHVRRRGWRLPAGYRHPPCDIMPAVVLVCAWPGLWYMDSRNIPRITTSYDIASTCRTTSSSVPPPQRFPRLPPACQLDQQPLPLLLPAWPRGSGVTAFQCQRQHPSPVQPATPPPGCSRPSANRAPTACYRFFAIHYFYRAKRRIPSNFFRL